MVTSYSVSETGDHSSSQPIYGLGQGTTNAPPNWTLIANVCQKAYAKHCKGCRILNPTGTVQLDAQGKIFVDVKNLIHNGKKPDASVKELMPIVMHDLSLWVCYIWITGGLIEWLKTEYSLMVWTSESTGAPQLTPEHKLPPNTVVIQQPDYTTTVKHIKETTASKMIGFHTALNQQNQSEWSYLKKKTN
eukprot:11259159-Ditylum_brightwellii.AAC.1